MVQYPRPYGFTRLYASRSEDLTITSQTQTCFNPAHTSTPRGSFSPCRCKQRNRLLNHIAISSCQILSYGWQHCSGLEHANIYMKRGLPAWEFPNHAHLWATAKEKCHHMPKRSTKSHVWSPTFPINYLLSVFIYTLVITWTMYETQAIENSMTLILRFKAIQVHEVNWQGNMMSYLCFIIIPHNIQPLEYSMNMLSR